MEDNYRIRHFPSFNNPDELLEIKRFLTENSLVESANEIIERTFGNLSGYPFNEWIDANHEFGNGMFEFYITIIYSQTETIAIGMVKPERNKEIEEQINLQTENIFGFKLVNVAVSSNYQKQGIGAALIDLIENMVTELLIGPFIEETKIDPLAYIWGEGGKGVHWENFGFKSKYDYITKLRMFYKNRGYTTQITDDSPFLFYKVIKFPNSDLDLTADLDNGSDLTTQQLRYFDNKNRYLELRSFLTK